LSLNLMAQVAQNCTKPPSEQRSNSYTAAARFNK
jgi:hypothetical protein